MTRRPPFFCFSTRQAQVELPSTRFALSDPPGLLAAGGDLAPATLQEAYARGVFPWSSRGEPLLWWAPDPRTVIEPSALHVSRSLARELTRIPWQITLNRCFERVIRACAAPRSEDGGTWLDADMIAAYCELHATGAAHSLEVWQGGELAGGIYGVAQGAVFCGESMFSRVRNGSKVALVALCARLVAWGYAVLDCQVDNPHLARMGAVAWPRARFEAALADSSPSRLTSWQTDPFGGVVRA